MAKFKKTFLTVALALCCVACSTLGILGFILKKTTVSAETVGETVPVYDIAQLNTDGPDSMLGNTSKNWGAGVVADPAFNAINFNNEGYAVNSQIVDSTTTYTLKSIGLMFDMKVNEAWAATCSNAVRFFICNTEVRWNYNYTNGFRLEIFDWNDPVKVENRAVRKNPNDTDHYIDNFIPTEYVTYKIVKSVKADDPSSYTLDIYMNDVHEYSASFTGIVVKQNSSWAVDQLRLYNNNVNTSAITVRTSHQADATAATDVYDYYADSAYLMGKPFESTWDNATNKATKNADVFDRSNLSKLSENAFGVSFKVKFNAALNTGKEVLRARIGTTFDVRVCAIQAGENGQARVHMFDWRDNSKTNTILSDRTATPFDIDFTQEHVYTFTKEKIEGTTSGYVYSAYVDGELVQSVVYNIAPAAPWGDSNDYANRLRIIVQNGNHTGTFSSADYYGVKVDDKVNKVNLGESYTFTAPEGKLCFGFEDEQGNVKAVGDTVSTVSTWNSICVTAENSNGAAIRMLHPDSSSLKWTTTINKTEYDALVSKYGAENVKVSYRIWTEEDTSKEINKVVDMSAVNTVGGAYEFYPLLSNIKENHFEWEFCYAAYITVTIDGEDITCEIKSENYARSIAYVAAQAYADYKTQEQYDAITNEAVKALYKYKITVDGNSVYSRYSTTQREILEKYFKKAE